MTYNIISTGSKGNAVIINDIILIDCGVPFKKLEPHIKPLKLALLTHIHGDHFKPSTARALHRERPALRWGCCYWMVEPLLEAGIDKRLIDVMELNKRYDYGRALGASVKPVPLVHDVPNCGYKLKANRERIFYATDTGTLDGISAKNYDLYMLEANHTRAELETRIAEKKVAEVFAYEYAAARNHLSQEQAMDWLAENAGANSKYVFLHQHEG